MAPFRYNFGGPSARTAIFWDVKECPLPANLDAGTVVNNIRIGLFRMGYRTHTSIKVYGDIFDVGTAFAGLPMSHVRADSEGAGRKEILVDFICEAIGEYSPLNLLLIVGDISQHPEFENAFFYLSMRPNINLLLAQPVKASFTYVTAQWLWSSLSLGGVPLTDQELLSDEDEEPRVNALSDQEALSDEDEDHRVKALSDQEALSDEDTLGSKLLVMKMKSLGSKLLVTPLVMSFLVTNVI